MNTKQRIAFAGLLLFIALVYSGVGGFGFVYNDSALLAAHPAIGGVKGAGDWFSPTFWASIFRPAPILAPWQPATTAASAMAQWIGAGGAGAHHLLQFVLHLANCAILYLLARRFLNFAGAMCATAAFGLMPVNVEAVAAIRGASMVVSTFFALVSTIVYLRIGDACAARAPWRKTGLYLILLFAASLAAFLGDASTLAFPGAILVLDLLTNAQWSARRLVPAVAVAGAFLVYYLIRIAEFGPGGGFFMRQVDFFLPPWRYRTLRFEIARDFFAALLWPFHSNAFRTLRVDLMEGSAEIRGAWWTVVAVLGGAFASAAASLKWAAPRVATALLLFMIILIIPHVLDTSVSGELLFTESMVYAASAGFCLLLGAAVEAAAGFSVAAAAVASIFIMSAFAWTSFERASVWRNEKTLFTISEIESPDSVTVKAALGRLFLERYQSTQDNELLEASLRKYQQVVDKSIRDKVYVSSRDVVPGYLAIASIRMYQGRAEDALSIYEQVAAESPQDAPEALMLSGIALSQLGNHELAEEKFKNAIAMRPAYATAWYNLGNAYLNRRMFSKATETLREAARLAPGTDEVALALATALWNDNKPGDAALIIQKLIDERPFHPDAARWRKILTSFK